MNWFSSNNKELLGVQELKDGVFKQGFQLINNGQYIVTAGFESEGEPYIVEFLLKIGNDSSMRPVGFALGVIFLALITVNILRCKKQYNTGVKQQ